MCFLPLSTQHPDYGTLASRIVVSNHQKNTDASFSNVMRNLYEFCDFHGKHSPLIAKPIWKYIENYSIVLDQMIDHNRDYLIDYFGFKTLERAYLFKLNKKVVERIQHMWLRVSVGIHANIDNPKKYSFDKRNLRYDVTKIFYTCYSNTF